MGTSIKSPLGALYTEDHPHAYGDKYLENKGLLKKVGSSPRVWGQEVQSVKCKLIMGIIPTRMGTRKLWNVNSCIN